MLTPDCSNTRLAKLDAPDGPFTALVLAKAGLVRLGLGHRITCHLRAPVLYHAVSQGALAVEIRAGDAHVHKLCKALTHQETQWKCLAERAMLRMLEGGCSVPVGVDTSLSDADKGEDGLKSGLLQITGCVTSLDGTAHVQHTLSAIVHNIEEVEELGVRLATTLMENGAKAILDDIARDRAERAT